MFNILHKRNPITKTDTSVNMVHTRRLYNQDWDGSQKHEFNFWLKGSLAQ